jgi:hypothetical protein
MMSKIINFIIENDIPQDKAIAFLTELVKDMGDDLENVDLGWTCGVCQSSNLQGDLICRSCGSPRPTIWRAS